MAIAKTNNTDDDFIKVGPDATATFDNSASNPTEHASSENLDAVDEEDDDLEDEDLDDDDEEEEDEEESDDVVEDEDEDDDEDDDEEDDEEDDHDLATGPKAPSVYRKA